MIIRLFHFSVLIGLVVLMSACAGPRGHIPLVSSFHKTHASKETTRLTSAYKALAPVLQYGASDGYGSGGVHTVLPGDTLSKIAAQYGVDIGDLIAMNNGVPMVTGARLSLPSPKSYRVRAGDTLFTLAKTFNSTPEKLSALNHLDKKLSLHAGQVLALPYAVKEQNIQEGMAARMPPVGIKKEKAKTPTLTKEDPFPLLMARIGGGGSSKQITASSDKVKSESGFQQASYVVPLRTQDRNVVGDMPAVRKPNATIAQTSIPPRAGNRFLRPVSGTILSRYGAKSGGLYNEGINIGAPRGAAVRSAENGRVVYVGNGAKGYGNLVLIKHADGYITAYAHMDKVLIENGDEVRRGETIGTVGSTGTVSRPQLHFEIRRGRNSVDPVAML